MRRTVDKSRRVMLFAVAAVLGAGLAVPLQTARADQPHMQAALDALRTAENQLQAATSDKGGHRQRALELVQRAIRQVEQGMKFDKRH